MNRSDRLLLEAVFFLILIAFTAAFIRLMQPFVLDLFLAFVLANIFRRPFGHLLHRWNRPRLAAGVTILLVLLVIAVPVAIVAGLVSTEISAAVNNVRQNWDSIRSVVSVSTIADQLNSIPLVGSLFERIPEVNLENELRTVVSTSADYLMRISQRSIGNATAAIFHFLIVLLLLFFFFTDGTRLVRRLYETLPVPNEEIDQIVRETFNTTSATLISTVIIGLMEGSLATILFLVFRLPSPFLWGIITLVLSMIPLIGTNLVLIPTGIVTIIAGRPAAGIVIIITGAVGVAITQNVIKPKLLGDRSGLNPALALLSTIGGIAWLGLIGFIIGPVLAALFVVVWRQFALRYRGLLERKNTGYEGEEIQ